MAMIKMNIFDPVLFSLLKFYFISDSILKLWKK